MKVAFTEMINPGSAWPQVAILASGLLSRNVNIKIYNSTCNFVLLETGLALRDEYPCRKLERGTSRRTFIPKPVEATVRRRKLNKRGGDS
jgi:gamma-glutamylcysteine synthetase